ncbi:MAG: hypothetical protein KC476_10415, partial [Cyanobacteria bacterium HKST-UBA06]|nr:hypothetical protein [Cyanobacteria bacterium HKST-UBA06]
MQSLSFWPPFRNQPITVHHTPADRPQFSGGLPAMAAAGLGDQFTTLLAQNQVLSRVFVEFFGYTGWNVALARNGWERFERAMDSVCWAVLGMGVPVLLGKMLVPRFNRNLKAEFPKAFLPKRLLKPGMVAKPMDLPFEWLDHAGFAQRFAKGTALSKQLPKYGLRNLPKALATKVLNRKLFAIMMLDYLALWAKANGYSWGKNWVTAHFSKKEGFSGIFNIASDDYRQEQVQDYKAHRKQRLFWSLGLSFLGSVAFPFIMSRALKSPVKAGSRGMMGWFKKKMPYFNYSNIVYMSKYALMWQVFWNWNLTGLMAARDKNERREHLMKCVATDFFFFVGDDFISGYMGKWLQNRYKKPLGGYQLMHTRRGLFGNPEAKGFHEIILEANSLANPVQRQLAKRLGKAILFSGIAGTALCLGISMTLLTQWFTKQKVRREEAERASRRRVAPVSVSVPVSVPVPRQIPGS